MRGRAEAFYDEEIATRQKLPTTERGVAVRHHSLYPDADCIKPKCLYKTVKSN